MIYYIYSIGKVQSAGTGKTTIAINLTIWLSKKGNKVLLIETDSIGPATLFTKTREKTLNGNIGYSMVKTSNGGLKNALPTLITKYTHIIIDLDSRNDAVVQLAHQHSDIIVIPFLPWANSMGLINSLPLSIATIKKNNNNVRVYAFINMGNQPGSSDKDIINELAKVDGLTVLNCKISKSKSFDEAAAKGLSLPELSNADQKVCDELSMLFSEITSSLEAQLPKGDTLSNKTKLSTLKKKTLESSKALNNGKLKQMNIGLTTDEVEQIRQIREKIPNTSRTAKKQLAISLHDWIVQAVQEKIKREL